VIEDIPYYGLMEATVNDVPVLVSQTGFSGEAGFEIYVREATANAEAVWNPVLETVEAHGGTVTGISHQRRIAAGIMSLGQDMDDQTSPFQVNLGFQVPDDKDADYIGKAELERQREAIDAGEFPFTHKLVGLKLAGEPIKDYAPDFWLVSDPETGEECGYVTSAWWNPELGTNLALGFVPAAKLQAATDVPLDDSIYDAEVDVEFAVHLPDEYAEAAGEPVYATVAKVPFKESVNPSAREQAKIHAREDTEASDARPSGDGE
jgi:aminomethyltransferase